MITKNNDNLVTLEDAKTVTDKLVQHFKPVSIILFGSVAQKGRGNDLDLMIIIDDNVYQVAEANRKIQKFLQPFYNHFSIDPFVAGISSIRACLRAGSPFLTKIFDEGVLFYMKNAFEEWKKNAEEDLAIAKYLLEGNFYRGACYHAQQAAEKAVKAKLLSKGWKLEKTHSIRRLLALSEQYGCNIQMNDDHITFLDSIYQGRYPVDKGLLPMGIPEKDDAKHAIQCAESAYKQVA